MNELDSYSINNSLNTAKSISGTAPISNESCMEMPVVVSCSRIDSRIILQNMEEVLDTVKRKHKAKHRRKKELKKLAKIDAADGPAIILSTNEESTDKRKELSAKQRVGKDKRRIKKKALPEKSIIDIDNIEQENIKHGTILHHFPLTPKKEIPTPIQDNEVETITMDESEHKCMLSPKSSIVTNAFEVMMNARNKSIGSNTPGKDFPSQAADNELTTTNAKRKLKLQEWAEEKGGAKRKLEEEERALYVEEKLEQRAKRFKNMLLSGGNIKKNLTETTTKNRAKTESNKLKEKIKPRRRKKHRAQRLSSLDSVDSLEQETPAEIDVERSKFLAKLNSPTKKRDSLLGYFPKADSSKELPIKNISEKTKKHKNIKNNDTLERSCKSGSKNHSVSSITSHKLRESVEVHVDIQSGRPRRTCTGRVRHRNDLECSPPMDTNQPKSTVVRKTAIHNVSDSNLNVQQELKSIEIINLDDEETPKKLAPLFVRTMSKHNLDPEIFRARKAFLKSGVPAKLRVEQERLKLFEEIEIFPKLSHIKQLTDNELKYNEEMHACSFKLKNEDNILLSPSLTRKSKIRSVKGQSIVGLLSDCNMHDFQLQKKKCQEVFLEQFLLPSLRNKRSIIKNWKTEFERFPTFKCYNQMREKYRYFSAIDSAQDTEQVSESFVVTRQTRRSLEMQKNKESDCTEEEYEPPETAPNGELLFTEKYKPLLFEQVLVNLNPVTQLKEFLSKWSNSNGGSVKNSRFPDDSMDLNDSACSSQGPSSNTVVLLGPVSSGKTNAVFVLANEMNFNVLEINAGMKRTGKRLIQELQEATQSHQIRKDAAGSCSSQKSLFKMSLNGLNSKRKIQNFNHNKTDSQNSDLSSSDIQNSARKCLILIEDADIVFEQTDAGFADAIYSLAASSKRPVIVVASNPNCAHLQRLITQNSINFYSPNVLNISKFLAVLSLIENCPVQLDDLISLYLYNCRDLRKTLLELQFFIQSGGDRQRQLLYKKSSKANEKDNSTYFASPRKRQFSVEQESASSDNNIPYDKDNISSTNSNEQVYMHRSLFEYYTVCQNSKWRIPFPVDFHILNANLNDIFQVSRKLKEDINHKSTENTKKITTKRKSRSPKKQWITTATENCKTPLENLCSFYENLSVAALISEQDNVYYVKNKHKPSIIDRLKPNISETISHCLLEKSIEENLAAELCPYNLFDTPKNCVFLSEKFSSMQWSSNRARYLDYEPSLRSICRSEKIRSTSQRRSTRFYHYLRNISINVSNFSTTHFDQACEAFQITDSETNNNHSSEPTTNTT